MTERLPIWRDASRVLLGVEQAVRGFGRYHKYSLDSDLRCSNAERGIRPVRNVWLLPANGFPRFKQLGTGSTPSPARGRGGISQG
jgi:hypothetical protein